MLDEIEERVDRRAQPLPVVGGGAQCLPYARHQILDVSLQDRQVQLKLAGKVLVKNVFADSGPFGDLVHAGGVVAAVHENLAGRDEQLTTSLVTGQPVPAPGGSAAARIRRPIAAAQLDRTPFGGAGEIAHQVLNLVVVAPVKRYAANRNDTTTHWLLGSPSMPPNVGRAGCP